MALAVFGMYVAEFEVKKKGGEGGRGEWRRNTL